MKRWYCACAAWWLGKTKTTFNKGAWTTLLVHSCHWGILSNFKFICRYMALIFYYCKLLSGVLQLPYAECVRFLIPGAGLHPRCVLPEVYALLTKKHNFLVPQNNGVCCRCWYYNKETAKNITLRQTESKPINCFFHSLVIKDGNTLSYK